MLRELNIKNFAIIDELNIEFGDGLNILTGETGAGKSIIVDALGLALGARSSADGIKHGKDHANVEAVFDISNNKNIHKYVKFIDIDIDDNELIMKRAISATGKNRCYINGSIVNLSVMRDIGKRLVDIHGQHEHQSLMDKRVHVDILDACTDLVHAREIVSYKYNLLNNKKKEINALLKRYKDRKERQDFLRFQIKDIERSGLKEGEDEVLEKEMDILSNAERLYQAARGGYYEIYSSDSAALTKLKNILCDLKAVSQIDTQIRKYVEDIRSITIELEEISLELRDYSHAVQFNPDRLNEIEERLSDIKAIKRKYGKNTIAEILDLKKESALELDNISVNQKQIEELQKEIDIIKEDVKLHAASLAESREKRAGGFESAVEAELKDLNMRDVKFKVDFSYDAAAATENQIEYKDKPVNLYSYGLGSIEFLFSSNIGEPPYPLTKIASGGEISRLMLVLKKILAKGDKIPTMIFDEIDSGTGGKTSGMIGDKLKAVSKSHQVLTITHLPQIACKADLHFKIEKGSYRNSTQTTVRKLGQKERIEELARMSGGKRITETTRKHAEEMMRL